MIIFFNRIFIAYYYTSAGVIKKKLQSCNDLSNIINEIKQESLENNYFFLYISYIYSFSIILLTIFEENILGISFQCRSQMTKINQSHRCQLINNLRINK